MNKVKVARELLKVAKLIISESYSVHALALDRKPNKAQRKAIMDIIFDKLRAISYLDDKYTPIKKYKEKLLEHIPESKRKKVDAVFPKWTKFAGYADYHGNRTKANNALKKLSKEIGLNVYLVAEEI